MATAPTTDEAADESCGEDETGDTAPDSNDTAPSRTEPRRGRRLLKWMSRLRPSGAGRDRSVSASIGQGLKSWARSLKPSRRIRLIDVLRVLGLARRAVPAPVVGPRAYTQWWQRILAFLALIVVVLAIGFALAALVGVGVVVAGFLLEQAIA